MSAQLLRVAQRLAGEGYHVVAPDVFHRFGGSNPDIAMTEGHIWKLTDADALADTRECVMTLREMGCTRIGAMGFCMGGRLSYLAAGAGLVDAAAPFYGVQMSALPQPTCPLAISMGALDQYVPADDLAALVERHGDDLVVYDGADHGFFRDHSPSYHEARSGRCVDARHDALRHPPALNAERGDAPPRELTRSGPRRDAPPARRCRGRACGAPR